MGCFHIEAFRAERRDVGHSEVIPESHCLLSTLSSCPPPLLPPPPICPGTSALTGKTCGSWQGLATGEGPRHHPLSTAPSQFSPRPNGGIWKARPCHERTGFWEHVWENRRTRGLGMRRRNCSPWKWCQEFLHQQNQECQSVECQAKLREASLGA